MNNETALASLADIHCNNIVQLLRSSSAVYACMKFHSPDLVCNFTNACINLCAHAVGLFCSFTFNVRFLSILENEIYNASSPIWREDFNQTPEALTAPSPASSSITPSHSPAGPSSVPAGPGSVSSRSGK